MRITGHQRTDERAASTVPAPRPGGSGKILSSPDGHGIRWRDGERLETVFEERCDALRRAGRGDDLAVDGITARLTYAELDAQANRVARFLIRRPGVRPGDRLGLLFGDAADGDIGMLAVLKAHAVYVPLDPGFPPGRLSYIARDAGLRAVLSHSRLAGLVRETEQARRAGDERGDDEDVAL